MVLTPAFQHESRGRDHLSVILSHRFLSRALCDVRCKRIVLESKSRFAAPLSAVRGQRNVSWRMPEKSLHSHAQRRSVLELSLRRLPAVFQPLPALCAGDCGGMAAADAGTTANRPKTGHGEHFESRPKRSLPMRQRLEVQKMLLEYMIFNVPCKRLFGEVLIVSGISRHSFPKQQTNRSHSGKFPLQIFHAG